MIPIFFTLAAVKSAACICLASITTGMVPKPCLVPALVIIERKYSTDGKAKLLSGVISRHDPEEN